LIIQKFLAEIANAELEGHEFLICPGKNDKNSDTISSDAG
jgi:hypothetical protein